MKSKSDLNLTVDGIEWEVYFDYSTDQGVEFTAVFSDITVTGKSHDPIDIELAIKEHMDGLDMDS